MNFFNSRQPIYQQPDNPLYPQPNNHESRISVLESQVEALQQQINSLQSQLTNLSGTVGGNMPYRSPDNHFPPTAIVLDKPITLQSKPPTYSVPSVKEILNQQETERFVNRAQYRGSI